MLFRSAMRGLDVLQEQGVKELNLSTTIMRQNQREAADLVELAAERQIPLVRFLPLRREGSAENNWIQIDACEDGTGAFFESVLNLDARAQQEARRVEVTSGLSGLMLHTPDTPEGGCSGCSSDMWCPTGRTMTIDFMGNAYPCIPFMDEQFHLGNVKEQRLAELHDSPRLRELYANIASRRQKVTQCRTCQVRNLCQGGCAGMVFKEKGTIWETDGFCEIRKQFFTDTIFDQANKKLNGSPTALPSGCGTG